MLVQVLLFQVASNKMQPGILSQVADSTVMISSSDPSATKLKVINKCEVHK